eukprot:729802-Pelagomonas_calceolata.AAC.2
MLKRLAARQHPATLACKEGVVSSMCRCFCDGRQRQTRGGKTQERKRRAQTRFCLAVRTQANHACQDPKHCAQTEHPEHQPCRRTQ